MSGGKNSELVENIADNSNMSIASEKSEKSQIDFSKAGLSLEKKLEDYNGAIPPTSSGNEIITRPSLAVECSKRPYLDGTWFKPDIENSSFEKGVDAFCQICIVDADSEPRATKGVLQSISNYKSHIQVILILIISNTSAYARS